MRHPRRFGLLAVAAMFGALVGAPGLTAAANAPITFDLRYGDSCIYGYSTPSDAVTIVWRDSTGGLKAQGTAPSNGFWAFCAADESTVVRIGDTIKVKDGTYVRKFIVPDLSLNIDRVSDLFRGTGPASRTIRLAYAIGLFNDNEESHSVRVGTDGHWSYDPHQDVPGGQYARLGWRTPHGDELELYGSSPTLTVTLGRSAFSGYTAAFTDVRVALRDPATSTRKATGTATSDGYGGFGGTFRNANGTAIPVSAGDRLRGLSFAADLNWIIPNVEGSADVATDFVYGRCFDTGVSDYFAQVRVLRPGGFRGASWVYPDDTGAFAVDFSQPDEFGHDHANIKHGDRVVIACWQSTGDIVQHIFRVP